MLRSLEMNVNTSEVSFSSSTLDKAVLGETLVVLKVDPPSLSPEWKKRLEEIGFVVGEQVRLMAKAYSIPLNTFAGGDKYMQYVADGFCKGGKLTCTDKTPTRTIGDVTFGPGLPNRGIVDLLKLWGTESSAVVGDD